LSGQKDLPDHSDTRSLHEESSVALRTSPEKATAIFVPSLSEAQQKAITGLSPELPSPSFHFTSRCCLSTDPTPESEASSALYSTAKQRTVSDINMAGKRVVSEKEWLALQQEVRSK
jgi:hypothetical protein